MQVYDLQILTHAACAQLRGCLPTDSLQEATTLNYTAATCNIRTEVKHHVWTGCQDKERNISHSTVHI